MAIAEGDEPSSLACKVGGLTVATSPRREETNMSTSTTVRTDEAYLEAISQGVMAIPGVSGNSHSAIEVAHSVLRWLKNRGLVGSPESPTVAYCFARAAEALQQGPHAPDRVGVANQWRGLGEAIATAQQEGLL